MMYPLLVGDGAPDILASPEPWTVEVTTEP